MTAFEPDGVYNSIPYRVLPDNSIEAMMPGGLVRFKTMEQLLASSASVATNTNATHSTMWGLTNERSGNIPAPARPPDYYSILLEAIRMAKQNSAQLRALVYERARFNLKRDFLFGHSSLGLADVVRQINEFELAVARVEANAIDDERYDPVSEEVEPHAIDHETRPSAVVQVLPPKPISPLYAGLQRTDNFQLARLSEEFVRHVRFAKKFIGVALLAIVLIAIVIIATLWPSHKEASRIEALNKISQTVDTPINHNVSNTNSTAATDSSPRAPFPLPNSFGIYVLSNDKLTELEALPINVPDSRIALSAEIKNPSTTIISDDRPAFILFRRDLQNNAPQRIMLRVIAQMARETKIVEGKVETANIEGAWRIRNISRELKISPIAGQREMVMARLGDDTPLAAGRYALILNRTGYDFTIAGPVKSPVFCLEKFEMTNGAVFNQCRTP